MEVVGGAALGVGVALIFIAAGYYFYQSVGVPLGVGSNVATFECQQACGQVHERMRDFCNASALTKARTEAYNNLRATFWTLVAAAAVLLLAIGQATASIVLAWTVPGLLAALALILAAILVIEGMMLHAAQDAANAVDQEWRANFKVIEAREILWQKCSAEEASKCEQSVPPCP